MGALWTGRPTNTIRNASVVRNPVGDIAICRALIGLETNTNVWNSGFITETVEQSDVWQMAP